MPTPIPGATLPRSRPRAHTWSCVDPTRTFRLNDRAHARNVLATRRLGPISWLPTWPSDGILALDLWDVIALAHGPLVFHEDNEAIICVCRSGRNPTMRQLLRSHSVSVAFLREIFDKGGMILQDGQSERQAAVMCTKALVLGGAWERVARLIGVGDVSLRRVSHCILGQTRHRRRRHSARPWQRRVGRLPCIPTGFRWHNRGAPTPLTRPLLGLLFPR